MDLHDRWQENKRWILGVLAGVVVFWVGMSLVRSFYGTADLRLRMLSDVRDVGKEPLYDAQALAALRKEEQALSAAESKLRATLEFKPRPAFLLQGKSDPPDLYFLKVSSDVKSRLLREADANNVELTDRNLQWSVPGPEETQAALLGLCLLDDAVTRLLAAHRAVRAQNPEALGLRAIQEFKVEDSKGSVHHASASKQKVDAADSIAEQSVKFAFQCDAATAYRFLESCDDPSRPLALSALKMTVGAQPGDPVTVTGKLIAVTFRNS